MARPTLVEDLLRELRADSLTRAGGKVVVAVSGGADSLALFDAMARARGALRLELTGAHFDHAMRSGSAADAQAVGALAAERGLAFRTSRHAGPMLRSEEAARNARHAFLEAVAEDIGTGTIAYAHTADDQVETLLLNMLRGTGPGGLAGMAVREGKRFRPLLRTWRSEVDDYCARRQLAPLVDPTNTEGRFLRNRVRHQLLPQLATFNPRVKDALLRLAVSAREEHEVVAALAASWLAEVPSDDRVALRALPAAVRLEVVRRLWGEAAGHPVPQGGAARVRQAAEWIAGPRREAVREVGGGVVLELRGDKFEFRKT